MKFLFSKVRRAQRWFFCLAVLMLSVTGAMPSAAAGKLPWTLRNHITFTVGESCLDYAEDDAEWRIRLGDDGVALDKAGFSISLGDGRMLIGMQLGQGTPDRTPFKSDLGEGTFYTQQFAPKDGLRVSHRIAAFREYPFAVLTVEVENVGTEPVTLARLSPVVLGPKSMPDWSSEALVLTRHAGSEGGYPSFGGEQPCVLAVFHDPVRQLSIGLGLLPRGDMTGSATFERGEEGWHGEIICGFDPPITLAPGRRIESDPVWISYGTPDPAKVSDYYSYAMSRMPRPLARHLPAMVWCTAPDEADFATLETQAKEWRKAGVRHALIPAGWERAPGAMQGANPRYPGNMASAAAALRKAGMTPGITLDPLQGDGEGAWVNPASEQAAAIAAQRVQRLQDWGFGFIVARPSAVPDAQLTAFGLTRQAANRLALERLIAAAGDMPVLPAARAAIAAERDAWLEAAAFSSRLAEFAITPAPLRMNTAGLNAISEELAAAMRLWPGPVEVVGLPTPEGLKQFARFTAHKRVPARSVDDASRVPLIWQANLKDDNGGYVGGAVIAFPGARAWNLADLRFDAADPLKIWRPEDGSLVDVNGTIVPADRGISVIGVSPHQDRPHLLGTSTGLALHLDRVKDLYWNETKSTLSGVIEGPIEDKGVAYIAVPEPWKMVEARLNGKKLTPRQIGNPTGECLMIAMDDSGMRFELAFAKP